MTVRAPGKAMLCGEYAVLEGAPAVVAAVDRYARARFAQHGQTSPSPFVREATRRAAEHVARTGKRAPTATPIVDSDGFRGPGGIKYGLGSSAAATVAAAAAVFDAAGLDVGAAEVRKSLHRLCAQAHQSAQEGSGSGADVAASIFGGILRFEHAADGPRTEPLALPAGLHLAFVWTGRAASTALLLERTRGAVRFGRMPDISATFASAFADGDARAVVETARLYGTAMRKLGDDCGVAIVTHEHALYMELARRHGGAAKPSGAGGGDISVAFLLDHDQAKALHAAAAHAGLHPLHLALDREGVKSESAS
ncbi:MAG TPA: hypothetical protein VKN99_09225 [Polyangia bacterium]|nr:hypothetical protein [Polyangia bacterium]